MNPNCRWRKPATHTPASWRQSRTCVPALSTIDIFWRVPIRHGHLQIRRRDHHGPCVRLPRPHHATTNTLQELADKVAILRLCDAQHLAFDPSPHPRPELKHTLWMSIPAVTESVGVGKRSVAEHGTFYAHDTHLQPKKKLTGTYVLFARDSPRD